VSVDYTLVAALRAEVAGRLHEEMTARQLAGPPATPEEERALAAALIRHALDARAMSSLQSGDQPLSPAEEAEYVDAVDALIYGSGRLQQYLVMEDLDNVIIHGADLAVLEFADGRVEFAPSPYSSSEELIDEVRTLAARRSRAARRFDRGHPRLDLRLPEGSRLTAVMGVVDRPVIVLRRHRFVDLSLADLVALGTMDERLAAFFTAAVPARLNMLLAGKTNVGKTTALRALLSLCPPTEHLVTVETSHELDLHRLARHPHVTPLEAQEANTEDEGEFTVEQLVLWSLRLNPDRMVVGECLGPEVVPMLNAMASGATGSMTTLHAKSSAAVPRRLASYVSQAPRPMPPRWVADAIADGLDLIVFLDFAREVDGRRRRVVASVREVLGAADERVLTRELFTPGPGGMGVPTGEVPDRAEDLEACGFDLTLLRVDPALR
jgi:Flp pilus assembly CpaF family ATPase